MSVKLNRQGRSRNIAKWVMIFVLAVTAYLGNRAVQSRLGDKALNAIEFQVNDLNSALQKAENEDKLVLASLSARFCPTCRKLDEEIFANPTIAQHIEQAFVFARIDYESEEGADFMQRYRVSGFPIMLILDGKGQRLTRLPLTFSVAEFAINLERVNQHYASTPHTDSAIQANSVSR